jgi:uracil-DNA glycosylase
LSDWADQGVILINRVLSTEVGRSLAHDTVGWQLITERVAQVLGDRDVIAVLWGGSALELKGYFREESIVSSVHPSPLSAYRGFFGSSPFSQVNEKLAQKGLPQILW